jgi:hypothetical protein
MTMPEHSRRSFLRGVGVTAAAATVAVIVPAGVASASENDDGSPTPAGPVLAYVKDPKSGTVAVMKGESEFLVTDKALARKLAKLAK